jgi:uncharacterized repeat protein (TIGR02543 family)
LNRIARISLLATLVLLLPSTLPANASTTRVWEAVNVAGAGLDTLANNSTVTVSFGKAGRHELGYGNTVGGAFYLTNSECGLVTPSPCVLAEIDGTVRFTFGAPQTHIKIHYGYVNVDDPEKVISNLGVVNMTAENLGGNLVSSAGNMLAAQAAGTTTSTGLIEAASGDRSGTVELRFASPGVTFIEFQNDFQAQGTPAANHGQNLVGLSLPVEYAQLTFNANSGAGTMSAQSAARATNISSNTFSYAGYTFAGWNTADDGSGSPFADIASFGFTADTLLYAQWTLTTVGTPTQITTAPAPTSLLAITGADNSRTFLIGGTATLLAIAGLMIFGIRRQLRKAE